MRLFVGIELPPNLRQVVADHISLQKSILPATKWVGPESLHITLSFIGEAEDSAVSRFDRPLSNSVVDQARFGLQLAGAGCFPRSRRAVRVVWIGVEDEAPVVELQSRVVASLEAADLLEPEHRPYHPHVTVARCKKPWTRAAGDSWESSLPGSLGEECKVTSIVLFRSRLESTGARYERLRSYPFGVDE